MSTFQPPSSESLVRRWVRAAGSARVAVAELLALALACAVATWSESPGGGKGGVIWDAPWFLFGLGMVGVTLVCTTLARWPWRRKDAGFVVTHYGILLLLIGGLVGYCYGFETYLRLHAGKSLRETQVVFALKEPVVVKREGGPSGVRIGLEMVEGQPRVTLQAGPLRKEGMPVLPLLGQTISWPEGSPLKLRFQGYWPDFAMGAGGPYSRSETPNNPALMVMLTVSGEAEPQTVPGLGAAVTLLHFEAPADGASDVPSDFRSTVRLSGPAGEAPVEAVISMNSPASYPPGFWRTALGLNTRFSQAEWNPEDLRESTLLARRDPGWPLKWLGSLLFCTGLVGMFYFR